MRTNMGIARFKSSVRSSAAMPGNLCVHKTVSLTVEPAGGGGRRKLFTISTGAVDRDNDTISVHGWVLASFARNPIVFFNHETYGYPIGKAVEIGVEGNALKSVVEFMPASIPDGAGETAESVFRQVDGGFLCSASVGFRPLEYAAAKDRMTDDDWWPAIDFTKQELMEWSIVGIPANPDASVDQDERAAVAELQRQGRAERGDRSISRAAYTRTAAEIARRRKELRAACY